MGHGLGWGVLRAKRDLAGVGGWIWVDIQVWEGMEMD